MRGVPLLPACLPLHTARQAREPPAVPVEEKEVVGVPDLNEVLPVPAVGRENVKRIYGYGFAFCFKCCEYHPDKGC